MAGRPASVGAFANNVQEFESFREFVTSATITTLVDLPFALLFIAAMAWIGGPIAWVPLRRLPGHRRFRLRAAATAVARRAGIASATPRSGRPTLVESLAASRRSRRSAPRAPRSARGSRRSGRSRGSDCVRGSCRARSSISRRFVQQLAYVAVIVCGVYLIAAERLTVGGLIACTLLTGRVLAPLSQIAVADHALPPGAHGAAVDRPPHAAASRAAREDTSS